MRHALPALTRFYGLRPWEVEQLTFDELDEYLNQYRQYLDDLKRREREAERG